MRLEIEKTDARSDGKSFKVIDADSRQVVGKVFASKRAAYPEDWEHNRSISLFGGKYEGSFNTDSECQAFIKGVEVVLNHMVTIDIATK
jgi:hypothetical protein